MGSASKMLLTSLILALVLISRSQCHCRARLPTAENIMQNYWICNPCIIMNFVSLWKESQQLSASMELWRWWWQRHSAMCVSTAILDHTALLRAPGALFPVKINRYPPDRRVCGPQSPSEPAIENCPFLCVIQILAWCKISLFSSVTKKLAVEMHVDNSNGRTATVIIMK